jgi:hypothetical protein
MFTLGKKKLNLAIVIWSLKDESDQFNIELLITPADFNILTTFLYSKD